MRRIKFRKPYKLKNYRFGLVALVLVLSIIGILVVGSANESYQSKQIFGVVIGLVVMAIVSLIDYVWTVSYTHLGYSDNHLWSYDKDYDFEHYRYCSCNHHLPFHVKGDVFRGESLEIYKRNESYKYHEITIRI